MPSPDPSHRRTRRRRRLLGVFGGFSVAVVLGVNGLCYRHAYAFTHYVEGIGPPPKPESLTVRQKLSIAFSGVPIRRPTNTQTPTNVGLPFRVVPIPVGGEFLEGWFVDHPSAKGVFVLGPGYMMAKDGLLPELRGVQALGYAALLIDFRGAGGSPGSDVTMGIREGEDFAAAIRFARTEWPNRPVIGYGFSMGAAALLKAVAAHGADPDAVVLDAPFDRMSNVIANRLKMVQAPSWPTGDLVLFWASRQLGVDAFAHNPADDARQVLVPALVLHGEQDTRATPGMVENVYANLGGPKRRITFPKAGHEPLARVDRARWQIEVAARLATIAR